MSEFLDAGWGQARPDAARGEADLDGEVRRRMELLFRWTAAIRHDLNNVLHVDPGALERLEGGVPEGGQTVRAVRSVLMAVDETRATLAGVGPVGREEGGGATPYDAWSRRFAPVARAVSPRGVRMRASASDLAVVFPASVRGVTGAALAVLLALEAQMVRAAVVADEDPAMEVGAEGDGAGASLIVRYAAAAGAIVMPTVVAETARASGGRVHLDAEIGGSGAARITWIGGS